MFVYCIGLSSPKSSFRSHFGALRLQCFRWPHILYEVLHLSFSVPFMKAEYTCPASHTDPISRMRRVTFFQLGRNSGNAQMYSRDVTDLHLYANLVYVLRFFMGTALWS